MVELIAHQSAKSKVTATADSMEKLTVQQKEFPRVSAMAPWIGNRDGDWLERAVGPFEG